MSLATLLSSLLPAARGGARIFALLRGILIVAFVSLAPFAAAEGIAVRAASIERTDDGWQVQADFDIRFSPRLEEAVNSGVPLYFIVEFELSKPRWYWLDEKPVVQSQMYKVSYTPLLRQYRLTVGNNYQNFARLEEVTRALSRVRDWYVADRGTIKKELTYQAALRMRLDTAQLPKPFQVNAIASRDWTLTSDWHRWSTTP